MTFLKDRPFYLMFCILAVVGFAADQVSKYVVFAQLYPPEGQFGVLQQVIPGCFDLYTHWAVPTPKAPDIHYSDDEPLSFLRTISGTRIPMLNKGALFGIGNDGEGLNTVFLTISILAAIFVVYWAARPHIATDRYLCLALGLILGGTLGNLYDRAVFGGVRDFLHWYVQLENGPKTWPDFNVADMCLVCGAGILLVHSFFVKDPEATPTAPATVAAAVPTPAVSTDTAVQK